MKHTILLDISIYSVVILTVIAFQYVVLSEQSVLGIPNKNASAPTNANPANATNAPSNGANTAANSSSNSHITQNVTMPISSNVSESGTKNNVTTSAGNEGNIYRGGTVSGSGGE
jgi:hypothetical protein